jgi:hypothetical protein
MLRASRLNKYYQLRSNNQPHQIYTSHSQKLKLKIMPIQFDKFDQAKVDNLKNHLVAMASKGKAKFYEIFVDVLKAVQKTDEPSEFDSYEDYMTPDSAQLKIVIYNSGASPRNDQFVFLLKAQNRDEAMEIGLSGMPVKTFSYNEIGEWREKQAKKTAERLEINTLKKEVSDLNGIIEDREKEIGQLGKLIEEARQNGNKLGGIHLGDIVSVAFEGLVRRNTHMIAKLPVLGEQLAGIIEDDNKKTIAPHSPSPDTEVNFKKKESTENPSPVSEGDKELLGLIKEIQMQFNENEFGQVIEILDLLSKDKSNLPTVIELLQQESEDE